MATTSNHTTGALNRLPPPAPTLFQITHENPLFIQTLRAMSWVAPQFAEMARGYDAVEALRRGDLDRFQPVDLTEQQEETSPVSGWNPLTWIIQMAEKTYQVFKSRL